MRLASYTTIAIALLVVMLTPYWTSPVFAQTIEVSSPKLMGSYPSLTVPGSYHTEVEVNVTSTSPIANVTLYYLTNTNDTRPAPVDTLFTPVAMRYNSGGDFNATYVVTLPPAANVSFWGFAKAFDIRGNSAGNAYAATFIYSTWSPNPNQTLFDLDLSVRHIDPKSMTMNVNRYAILKNYATYLQDRFESFGESDRPELDLTLSLGAFSYQSPRDAMNLYYQQGVPELYPFDTYNFTYTLRLADYLNSSGRVQVNEITLYPYVPYPDLVGLAINQNLTEKQDNSAWIVHSSAEFYPSNNFTARPPVLQVTISLKRQPQQVDFLLLVPVLSLYALLGFSVLLRGPNELQNRLLLYLTVFLFAYGFQSNVKVLAMTPIVSGFSMIELMVLALIPITVILSVASIIMRVTGHWPDDDIHITDRYGIRATSLDVFSILFSEVTLWSIVQVTVKTYRCCFTLVSVNYTLANLSFWGILTIIFLALGLFVNLFFVLWRYYGPRHGGSGGRHEDANTHSPTELAAESTSAIIAIVAVIALTMLKDYFDSGRD